MGELLGIPLPVLLGQLLVGLINGSFYALLSLGLAIIFGLLHIVNFTHGAQYMLGAFCAWLMLQHLGLGYWPALVISPILVGLCGAALERIFLRRIYRLDHFYGLLLTLGLSLIIEGVLREHYGATGQRYEIPKSLSGTINLGFMYLPIYRAWVVLLSLAVCFGTWLLIERTRLGSYLRAATENPQLVEAFGINVPRLITLTYACGVALAALGGVMAAPIYQVSPLMGSDIIIVVFAVVVIGGMGSLLGAVVGGFGLGIIEGLTKVFYPQAAATSIFIVMALVLLLRPSGLFGRGLVQHIPQYESGPPASSQIPGGTLTGAVLLALGLTAPLFIYPLFAMKVLCFALFAVAFGLLAGFGGLVSFGHAAFFGAAAYTTAHTTKLWGITPDMGILCGTAVATAMGLAFGWLSIRRQGIYFAMITMAFAQMVFFFAVQAPFTGGEDGIQGVPRGRFLGMIDLNNKYVMYYFVFAVFLLGFYVIYRTIRSPFGQILKAVRENELRAISLGYDVGRVKLTAFVISAAISGLAGGTKALVMQIATLADVHWALSGDVLLMGLIGGIGNVIGPLIGAAVVIAMQTHLAGLGGWVTVIQGVAFVACVLMFRRGITGGAELVLQRLKGGVIGRTSCNMQPLK